MPKDSPNRIVGLDGLRAISISLVMFSHLLGTRNGPLMTGWLHWLDLGSFGVRVFFVISGFLITSLLLDERHARGTVSLRGFYWRRSLRIFPANYLFIGIIAACAATGWITLKDGDLLHAATYTMNKQGDHAPWLKHLWSLSVEEQFYLLWPSLVVFLAARGSKGAAVFAICAAPLARFLLLFATPAHEAMLEDTFPFVADNLAMGCLLALSRQQLSAAPAYLRFLESPWFWLVPAAIALAFAMPTTAFHEVLMPTVHALGIALIIDRVARLPRSGLARFLELAPLVWIGTISYSLYLWQEPFLNREATAWWAAFPINVAFAVAAASASYYLVERPFRAIGQRLAGRITPGSP